MDANTEISEELKKNYIFDGNTYTYKDAESNQVYIWDLEKKTWIEQPDSGGVRTTSSRSAKKLATMEQKNEDDELDTDEEEEGNPKSKTQDMTRGVYGYEGDTRTYTDMQDKTVYFWDKEKNAWFPKIDDTFIAHYQMNYGFNNDTETPSSEPNAKLIEEKDEKKTQGANEIANLKRKAEPEPPKWFNIDDEHNTKVYVSNLPLNITETEFVNLMGKCGLIMKELDTGKMKVKLYVDPVSKMFKGDALCTYIKKESVNLALKLLDGSDFRGHKIRIEKAQFTMKGNAYDPNLKPKKKRRKDKEKMKKMQERLFAWQPDKLRGERGKNERVVIIKNLFDPTVFDENLGLILEYQQDIREECSKCGDVKKVVIYDKHQDGVAQVSFKEAEAADACIQLLNNRWFSKRLITAETWDGKTKYKVQETAEETEARLKKWEEYLNSNKENKEGGPGEGSTAPNELPEENDSDGTRSSADSGDETEDEASVN